MSFGIYNLQMLKLNRPHVWAPGTRYGQEALLYTLDYFHWNSIPESPRSAVHKLCCSGLKLPGLDLKWTGTRSKLLPLFLPTAWLWRRQVAALPGRDKAPCHLSTARCRQCPCCSTPLVPGHCQPPQVQRLNPMFLRATHC